MRTALFSLVKAPEIVCGYTYCLLCGYFVYRAGEERRTVYVQSLQTRFVWELYTLFCFQSLTLSRGSKHSC